LILFAIQQRAGIYWAGKVFIIKQMLNKNKFIDKTILNKTKQIFLSK